MSTCVHVVKWNTQSLRTRLVRVARWHMYMRVSLICIVTCACWHRYVFRYTWVCAGIHMCVWVCGCVCVCVCVCDDVCVCGRGECIAEHIHTHCVWMNVCVEEVGVATYSAVDDEGGSEGDEVSYDIGVC